MRATIFQWARLACFVASALLLDVGIARAACDPASCDETFACGSRECIGLTCETFLEDAGTECRPAAGVCDRAETCNGSSLACPGDAKRSAAFECRGVAPNNFCDATEHCDGTSDDCPDDVGIPPTISRVTALDVGLSASDRRIEVEVLGEDLCDATVSELVPHVSFGMLPSTPRTRLVTSYDYLQADGPIESGTMRLQLNQGAIEGTIEWAAGAPDGSIEILSPGDGATVRSHPIFSVGNSCSTCDGVRIAISGPNVRVETPYFAEPPPPFEQPAALGLGDFVGTPLPSGLPENSYVLRTDAIAGTTIVEDASLAGDTSGVHFIYKSGTSVRNEISFSVPEPPALPDALAAILALAPVAATRGAQRRRR